MYQVDFTNTGITTVGLDMYPNITSLTGLLPGTSPYTYKILCGFRGRNTNWFRTGIAQEGTGSRNSRYWRARFTFYSSSFNGLFDQVALRQSGNIFLPSQEIYDVEFYYQTSDTNLSIGAATKIDNYINVINVDRQTDDLYNQAPISSYTQYTDNDLTPIQIYNTNVEYGTQTS